MCKLSHHVSSSCVSLTTAPLGAGGRGLGTTVGARSTSEIQGAELQTALTSEAPTQAKQRGFKMSCSEMGSSHSARTPLQCFELQPVKIF